MASGGPRLGKLQGLKREDDDDDPQAKQRRPAKKGGIKVRQENDDPRRPECPAGSWAENRSLPFVEPT